MKGINAENHAAEAPKTKGLADTTSAHDDWLRRGPFLYDFDFHTYVRCVRRVPRPRNICNEGGHRRVPLFLFDSHYVLAQQYVQELDVQGQCEVVVLEALKSPSSDLNNGEDNSAFKSVLGTLLTCPGRGNCNIRHRTTRRRCSHVAINGKPDVQTSRFLLVEPRRRLTEQIEFLCWRM